MSREGRERRSRSPGSYRVFMGRLPRDVRRRDLEDFFKDAGFSKAVKDITLKTGFAFIVSMTCYLHIRLPVICEIFWNNFNISVMKLTCIGSWTVFLFNLALGPPINQCQIETQR